MEITGLIKRCRQGDADALGELYKAYASRMRGVCLRYVSDRQAVDDVLGTFSPAKVAGNCVKRVHNRSQVFTSEVKTVHRGGYMEKIQFPRGTMRLYWSLGRNGCQKIPLFQAG